MIGYHQTGSGKASIPVTEGGDCHYCFGYDGYSIFYSYYILHGATQIFVTTLSVVVFHAVYSAPRTIFELTNPYRSIDESTMHPFTHTTIALLHELICTINITHEHQNYLAP